MDARAHGEATAAFATHAEVIVVRADDDPFVGGAGEHGDDVAIGLAEMLDGGAEFGADLGQDEAAAHVVSGHAQVLTRSLRQSASGRTPG